LNYGYAVLAGEISKFVCGIGLDPYFGFMHKSHTGFQPLVYDIIEPFRWLVDYSYLGNLVIDFPILIGFIYLLFLSFVNFLNSRNARNLVPQSITVY